MAADSIGHVAVTMSLDSEQFVRGLKRAEQETKRTSAAIEREASKQFRRDTSIEDMRASFMKRERDASGRFLPQAFGTSAYQKREAFQYAHGMMSTWTAQGGMGQDFWNKAKAGSQVVRQLEERSYGLRNASRAAAAAMVGNFAPAMGVIVRHALPAVAAFKAVEASARLANFATNEYSRGGWSNVFSKGGKAALAGAGALLPKIPLLGSAVTGTSEAMKDMLGLSDFEMRFKASTKYRADYSTWQKSLQEQRSGIVGGAKAARAGLLDDYMDEARPYQQRLRMIRRDAQEHIAVENDRYAALRRLGRVRREDEAEIAENIRIIRMKQLRQEGDYWNSLVQMVRDGEDKKSKAEYAAWEKTRDFEKRLDKQSADIRQARWDEANAVRESVYTPKEKAARELFKLGKLWSQGDIDRETFDRATQQLGYNTRGAKNNDVIGWLMRMTAAVERNYGLQHGELRVRFMGI